MEKLKELLKDVDIYIANHAIFINKLEKAVKNKSPIDAVDCHSCKFGQNFDKDIRNDIPNYEPEIRKILEEIDQIHCTFHEKAIQLSKENDEEKKQEILKEIKGLSTQLFRKLLYLKKTVLS